MAKVLRNTLIVFGTLACVLWLGFQTAIVQSWIIKRVENEVAKNSDYSIKIGSLNGLPPFLVGVNDIQVFEKTVPICTIQSISLVPAWIDLACGKISFLSFKVQGLSVNEAYLNSSDSEQTSLPSVSECLKNFLPNIPIRISSLQISNIQIRAFAPIKPDSEMSSLLELESDIDGALSWEPKDTHFFAKLAIGSSLKSKQFLSLKTEFEIIKSEGNLGLSLELKKKQHLALTDSLPTKSLQLRIDLAYGKEKEHSTTAQNPLLNGTWRLWALPDDSWGVQYPTLYGVSAHGAIHATQEGALSFITKEIQGHTVLSQALESDDAGIGLGLFYNAPPSDISAHTQEFRFPFPIQGNIEGSLHCTKDPKNLAFHLALKSSELRLQDLLFQSIDTKMVLQKGKNNWFGTISGKTSISQLQKTQEKTETSWPHKPFPIELSCSLKTDGTSFFDVHDLSLSCGHLPIKGNVHVGINPFFVKGKLLGEIAEIDECAKLFQANVQGQGNFSLTIGPKDEKSTSKSAPITHEIDCKIMVHKAQIPGFVAEKAFVHIQGSGLLTKLNIETKIGFENASTHDLDLQTASLSSKFSVVPSTQSIPFLIDIQGHSKRGALVLQTEGSFGIAHSKHNHEHFFAKLHSFSYQSGQAKMTSSEPLELQVTDDAIKLLPVAISFNNGGTFSCNFLAKKEAVSGTFDIKKAPIELIDPLFSNLVFSGHLSANGQIFGTAESPQIVIQTETSDLAWWDTSLEHFPSLSFVSQIDLEKDLLRISGELKGFRAKKPLAWNFHVPFQLKFFPFTASVPEKLPVTGSITGEADLASCLSHYLDDDESVEGDFSIDLALTGDSSQPYFKGNIFVENGRFDLNTTGADFSHIAVQIDIEGDTFQIAKLTGIDDEQGTFTGTGWLKLDLEQNIPYEVDLKFNKMKVMDLDIAKVSANGDVKLLGNADKMILSGNLVTENATFNLASNFSTDLPKLDIIWITQEDDLPKPTNQGFDVGLDLDIDIPQAIISGRRLQTEWAGKTKIVGPVNSLQLLGRMECTTGTVAFANKNFVISHGTIDFGGDLLTQSRLNVIATVDLTQVTAQIIIRGSLDTPRLVLQSSPAMEDKDIISWILFNKSSTEITPFEGVQLAQILISMNESTASFDILAQVKNKLGLDRVDITTGNQVLPPTLGKSPGIASSDNPVDPTNEARFEVGKYISNGVLVNISKDINDESSWAGVEVNLSKNITAEAEVAPEGEAQVSLNWKHNY